MPLALFDLDNTLIAGDSDHAWGEFLVRMGKVDATEHQRRNDQFFQDYQAGRLDINAYLGFALAPLSTIPIGELVHLHRQFMSEVISAWWLPRAEAVIARHRDAGDHLVVITSTNRFVVEPICARLGITDLIATELEQIDERYTGNILGVPSYRDGKLIRLRQWLENRDHSLAGSYFYSDSINDLPLLQHVDNPVAVDPDPQLRAVASREGWPIISLRGD
ncbi:MAG: HAD family hydrolase [Porticoccaceae bacterium]